MTKLIKTIISLTKLTILIYIAILPCQEANAIELKFAEVGANIEIGCNASIDRSSLDSLRFVSVAWKWKPKNESEWLPVPVINVELPPGNHQLDNRKNLTLSILSLTAVQLNSSGLYACFLDGKSAPLDQTELLVGYQPDKPSNISCHTNAPLTEMLCHWDSGKDTYMLTKYEVNVVIEMGSELKNFVVPTSVDRVTINVKSTYTFFYFLNVTASNILGEATSNTFEIIPSFIVKPDPPKEIEVHDYNGIPPEKSSLSVTWMEPDVNIMLDLFYRLRYRQSSGGNGWKVVETMTDKTYYIINNLSPFTNYDIQLAAQPNPNAFIFNGTWGGWSDILSFRTALKVPSQHFLFHDITATSTSSDFKSDWKIEATWNIYTESSQPGFYYNISYHFLGKSEQQRLRQNNVTFSVPYYSEDLSISGRFCNELGCSTSSEEKIDLKFAPPAIQNLTLSMNSTHANLNWNSNSKTDVQQIRSKDECLVKICSSNRLASTVLENSLCQINLKEITLLCSDNNVSIGIAVSPCQEYHATVYRIERIGIQKIMTPSKSSSKATIQTWPLHATDFVASDVTSPKGYAIETKWKWKQSQCNTSYTDMFLAVLFSPLFGSECNGGSKCSLSQPYFKKLTECTDTTLLVENKLYGDTMYGLSMGQCCISSISTSKGECFSDSSLFDTVNTSIGVPGIPRSLNWSPSKPLKVKWNPPQHRNGIIDGYILRIAQTENNTKNINEFEEHRTARPEMELKIDCPFAEDSTLYHVHVAAYNIKEGKELLGEFLKREGYLCKFVNPNSVDPKDSVNFTALIAGLFASIVAILTILSVAVFKRKYLKRSVKKYIWPSVPSPCILISIFDGNDEEKKQNDVNYDVNDFHLNSAYSSTSKFDDDQSYMEIPDRICDDRLVKISNNNNLGEFPDELITDVKIDEEKRCSDIMDCIQNVPGSNREVCSSQSCDDSPSCSSSVETDGEFFEINSTKTTASWRSTMFLKPTSKTEIQRPHSFAGSYGGSFSGASYVKNCSDVMSSTFNSAIGNPSSPNCLSSSNCTKQRQKSSQTSSLTNLSTCFHVVEPGSDISCADSNPHSRLLKHKAESTNDYQRYCEESWKQDNVFEFNGLLAQTSDFGSAKFTDIDTTSPYVTLPTTDFEGMSEIGLDSDVISDCFCDFLVDNYKNKSKINFPSSPAQVFTAASDKFYFNTKAEVPIWEINVQSAPYVMDCSNKSLSDAPLLECCSPTSLAEDSYVSVNDAIISSELFKSDQSNEKSDINCFIKRDQFSFKKFTFDDQESYVSSSLSNAGSYVSEFPCKSTSERKLEQCFCLGAAEADLAPYVTSVEDAQSSQA